MASSVRPERVGAELWIQGRTKAEGTDMVHGVGYSAEVPAALRVFPPVSIGEMKG